MELRHLRYFIAVAEELNFTRAAERLGISQPPLSSQIRQLEKGLGTPLFHRHARSVELTDAGKLLLEEARVILKQVEVAENGVRRRARGETGRIVVGSAGATYFHPTIPAIIREYGKRYPDIVLAPQASNTALLVARLRAGQCDIAFIRPPIEDASGLAIDPLVDEDSVIVLPVGHRLSRLASVSPYTLYTGTPVTASRELLTAVVSRLPVTPCSGLKMAVSSIPGTCARRSIVRCPCVSIPVWLVTSPMRTGLARSGCSSRKSCISSTSIPVFTAPLRTVNRRSAILDSL